MIFCVSYSSVDIANCPCFDGWSDFCYFYIVNNSLRLFLCLQLGRGQIASADRSYCNADVIQTIDAL